jgi:chemotaxis protein MotB
MSRPHRRRGGGDDHGGGGGGHGGGDERWMASYMDMVTVLMCLFIVLFAMSTVDQEKYWALKNSLATGFGAESSETVDTASGVVVPAELVDSEGEGFAGMSRAESEIADLQALQQAILGQLETAGSADSVEFAYDERGLIVRLTGGQTFFDTNSAVLAPQAPDILRVIGGALATTGYEVQIEGHADSRQPTGLYPTNWELSAARATSVLRFLVEQGGIAAARIGSVGYGDARPIVAGTTAEELAANRRVDIVVLSDEPEEVRALFAQVLGAQGVVVEGEPADAAGAEQDAVPASGTDAVDDEHATGTKAAADAHAEDDHEEEDSAH